mgnify:FL=1
MRVAALLLVLVGSGCTLIVGTDARQVADDAATDSSAGTQPDASPDARPPDAPQEPGPDADGAPDVSTCDVPGCNAAHASCKSTCEDAASVCVADCNSGGGDIKSCASACTKQEQHCYATCQSICNTCVKGCGPPCPP